MTTGQRIKEMRKKMGITADDIAAELGISRSTVFRWENGDIEKLPTSILEPISKILNTTPAYLMGWTDDDIDYKEIDTAEFNQDVFQELLELHDDEESAIRAYLAFEKAQAADAKFGMWIELPYYDYPASAGLGSYLLTEGHDFEMKEFKNVPSNATFAVRIRGDSMQPLYNDNDTVFVRSGVIVEQGQIGIFIVNGESYLKQFSGTKLVSLNSKYPPKEIDEFDEFHCVGRVVGKVEN